MPAPSGRVGAVGVDMAKRPRPSMTVSMRPRNLKALSGMVFQIGLSTARTSSVLISSTGFERIRRARLS
jgi:hypothetical protein